MMKKLGLSILMVCLSVLGMNAQNYVFKILASKGNSKVMANGAWTDVAAGAKLNKGDKVKLESGSYLGLIHPTTGKTLELKSAGTFAVNELESKIITGKADFGTKYAKYVEEGMFSANTGAKTSYNRTGTVDRKIPDPINIYAPTNISALKNDPLKLHWSECGKNHKFEVKLIDMFQEEVFSKIVDTNYLVINFNELKKASAGIEESAASSFVLKVKNLTNASYNNGLDKESFEIKFLDEATEKRITEEISVVKASMDKKNAMDFMVLGMAYERNGLPAYAVDAYAKAKQLAPQVDDFDKQYEEYIKLYTGLSDIRSSLNIKK